MSDFQAAKIFLIHLTGLPRDALHIYVGLAVMLGVAAFAGRSLRDPRPIAAVLLVALAGEVWDLFDTPGPDKVLMCMAPPSESGCTQVRPSRR